MQRVIVQVLQVRMSDVRPGDVINRSHVEPRGWFEVREVLPLPNGDVAVVAVHEKNSINGTPHDIVGLQVRHVAQVPEQIAA